MGGVPHSDGCTEDIMTFFTITHIHTFDSKKTLEIRCKYPLPPKSTHDDLHAKYLMCGKTHVIVLVNLEIL